MLVKLNCDPLPQSLLVPVGELSLILETPFPRRVAGKIFNIFWTISHDQCARTVIAALLSDRIPLDSWSRFL